MKRRGFIGMVIVIALMIGSFFLSGFLRPHTQAYSGHCLQRDDGILKNGCEFSIEAALCYRIDKTGKNSDICYRQTLGPGDQFTGEPTALPEGIPYTMACKSPFPPAWRQSNSNAALWRKGCKRAPAE